MSRLLLLIVALLIMRPASAQDFAAVDRGVEALMDSARVQGVGIAVVRGGEVVYQAGYGVRSSVTSPAVDTLTVFEGASLTKPVVALAVLQMADEGLLDLDRPLLEYAVYDDIAHDPRDAQVSARMVLSHTSGLPNWRIPEGRLEFSDDPGVAFGYSGEGFVWLQSVVERIEGKPIHAVVRDRVFRPLGLDRSSLVWQDTFGPHIAVGHAADGTAFDKFTPAEGNAAFTLHTTAGDFARFLAASMAGATLSDLMARDQRSFQSDAGQGIGWGLGWGIEQTSEGPALWHWGDNRGYKAFVSGRPGTGDGFVYLTNSDNGMLMLPHVAGLLDAASHPAIDWLNYERFDDASFRANRDIADVLLADGVEAALDRYRELRAVAEPGVFDEFTLNDLGYRLLRLGRMEEAIAVFETNVAEYPGAANPHDSLGEAYFVAGRLEEALAEYRRSVSLDPESEGGVAMIARIEALLSER